MRATGANGGDSAIVVGQPKSFTFEGTGLEAGDKVKFVAAAAVVDRDCWLHPSSGTLTDGGEAGATVGSGGIANIKALETSPKGSPWKLCYKFGDHDWRLYPDLVLTAKVCVCVCCVCVVCVFVAVCLSLSLFLSLSLSLSLCGCSTRCDARTAACTAPGFGF